MNLYRQLAHEAPSAKERYGNGPTRLLRTVMVSAQLAPAGGQGSAGRLLHHLRVWQDKRGSVQVPSDETYQASDTRGLLETQQNSQGPSGQGNWEPSKQVK